MKNVSLKSMIIEDTWDDETSIKWEDLDLLIHNVSNAE